MSSCWSRARVKLCLYCILILIRISKILRVTRHSNLKKIVCFCWYMRFLHTKSNSQAYRFTMDKWHIFYSASNENIVEVLSLFHSRLNPMRTPPTMVGGVHSYLLYSGKCGPKVRGNFYRLSHSMKWFGMRSESWGVGLL